MRVFIFIIAIFHCITSSAQRVDEVNWKTADTIQLARLRAKKIIVFSQNGVRFFLEYRSFRHHLNKLKKDKSKDIFHQFLKIDSLVKYARLQFGRSDTAYMRPSDFYMVYFNWIGEFIASSIDKGSCMIRDETGMDHFTVIRRKGGYYKGFKEAWSGHAYFLPGHKEYFLRIDSIIA